MTEHELKNAVLDEIAARAPHYTPEWRFNPSSPDVGTALATLWADMFAGTLKRFGSLPDNYKRALLDALGSEPRPPVAAHGYLSFAVHEDADDFVIPPGTAVLSPSVPDAALETIREIAASPAKIKAIYCVLPSHDVAARHDGMTDIDLFRVPQGKGHIWTFSHDFALDISTSAALRIIPHMDGDGLEILAASCWEYLDVDGLWHGMTATRDGAALVCGFPASKNRCRAVRVSVTRDAVLHNISAKPSGAGLLPDALYTDDAQETDGFHPFGQRFIPGISAYFACVDALSKPGARVELAFNLSYGSFELEGYPDAQIRMKKIMREADLEPPKEYEICVAEVKWEYYNGVGWAALEAEGGLQIFSGKLSGRITLAFDCPADLCPALVGAHDLPFIRARLTAVDNLYRQRGYYKAPVMSDIRFSYRYPSNGVPVTDVSVAEHLDSREAKLPTRLAAPPDGPPALYFAFDHELTRGAILFRIKPGGLETASHWEYLSGSDWKFLDVRDDTGGLNRTGILNYQVQSLMPATKARLWGCEAYWLRLVLDGEYPDARLSGPRLISLHENSAPARGRTPGRSSVLPPDSFTITAAPLAGVESAANPVWTYGGNDGEEEGEVVSRLCASLSHSGRAVSAVDYETLAQEASVCVLRARYYPHTDGHGENAYGESCLAILPKHGELFGFGKLRSEILSYIAPRRALGSGKLHIVPPRYIAVHVSAHVIIEALGEALAVKKRIEDTLETLLSPLNREIGQLPSPGQIHTALRAISGVTRLIRAETSYTIGPGICADYTRALREAFAMPVNGRHDISFTGIV